jgi:serine/threonine protein kinase/tetratricopeptide (TPR) repeat protein
VSSLVGRTLARYEILEEISRGGMGVVYRARDVRLNRDVALKVLPPELVADPARRARFVQEARAASALEHPHIAVIHEIDEVEGISFIAMELLRGEKLADLTARGPLSPSRALDLGVEIAEGLARAHDKGIVHRDLKPANVVLTEDEHAKIIDFGLAKLVEALSGESGGLTMAKAETDPGMVLGTVSYMSPEQARGAKVDHRSDIFSFGVLLHEMLTGRPPFRGNTGIDTMHAILHNPVPPLPPLGGTVTAEATSDVQRLLEKCLAKDPGERYQGMRDIVVDLRGARRRLESTTAVSAISGAARATTTSEGFMRARTWAFAAAGIFVLALLGYNAWRTRQSTPTSTASSKPSVAVLYFENNTGNPQLDWLRTGLTDMLVTDLSQSPDVEVLGTDRLVQILTAMRRQDDRVVSFDTVQEIAKRAGVTSVLLGSYVKAGDTIRINTKLQEASTGRIVTSERVEAIGESNLFATVDDLTRRIKAKFALPSNVNPTAGLLKPPSAATTTAGSGIDRDLTDVTTSSIDAYRYYAEGVDLHQRGREREAVPLLEKAVELDPSFAMAYGKLSVVHNNLVHLTLADEYGKRALEHVERLTPRERYYIEGVSYSRHNDSIGRAIDAYKKAIELYPDHASARHNLANIYAGLERYQEAIPQYEDLQRRGMTFPSTYGNLANSYAKTGNFEKGYQVLQQFLLTNPESGAAQLDFADYLGAWGKLDEAAAAYDRAEALAPGSPFVALGRLNLAMLSERWADVETHLRTLRQSSDSFAKWLGGIGGGNAALLKGRSNEAIRLFGAAAAGEGPNGSPLSAFARISAGGVLLDTGRAALALTEAQRAFKEAGGRDGEWESLELAAVAQGRLGHQADAAKTLGDLSRRADGLPSDREKRRVHDAAGLLALDQHDVPRGVLELTQADAMLPVADVPGPLPPHVPIWFDFANAQMQAGNLAGAKTRFQRIVDGGTMRTGYPIEFVRSLYFLGQISERQGDADKARAFYRRFVQYWGGGDIDRERVYEARKKLAGT